MALSLSVIAGIALLLPGLFAILFWNIRSRRHPASRPDLPITAVSVLAFSIAISLVSHLVAWLGASAVLDLAVEIGRGLPARFQPHLYPALPNPIEVMLAMAKGGTAADPLKPWEVGFAAATLLVECLAVVGFLADDGLDLALDGVDFGNQGWVYTHIVQPAQNGYRPVAFVLTTLAKDGLGIGYRGTVADIRQSDRGETLSITLGEPARFLFELKPGSRERGYGKGDSDAAFVRHPEEDVGSVVSLNASVIQNIVVANRKTSQLELLAVLEDEREKVEGPLESADA